MCVNIQIKWIKNIKMKKNYPKGQFLFNDEFCCLVSNLLKLHPVLISVE